MAQAQQQSELVKALVRSEEHTSELQSRFDIVCRLLLEIKKPSSCPRDMLRLHVYSISTSALFPGSPAGRTTPHHVPTSITTGILKHCSSKARQTDDSVS